MYLLTKEGKNGSRERVLSLYSKNMMHLNPSLTKSDLFKLVSAANTLRLDNPLSYKEFKSIVDTTYTNRSEYHPPNNKTKRFLFKDNTLTPAQKSRLCLNVIHAERRQETQEKKIHYQKYSVIGIAIQMAKYLPKELWS